MGKQLSAENLAQARAMFTPGSDGYDSDQPQIVGRMLLRHIDAQARQIERLEAAVDFAIEILGHIDVASREPQSAAPDFLRENMRICGDVARKAMPTLRAASDEGDTR